MSDFNPFAQPTGGGAAHYYPEEEPTVEEILEQGLHLAGASPAHIVLRGRPDHASIRCDWRGIARTPTQREEGLRFWWGLDENEPLPPPAVMETMSVGFLSALGSPYPATLLSNFLALSRGGVSTEYEFLACYADYEVQEYMLGDGPSTVTVAYDRLGETRSYDLYKASHAAGEFGGEALKSEQDYDRFRLEQALAVETLLSSLLGGRESVVFLAPLAAHNTIAVQSWQAIAQWDLQLAEGDQVDAVRYGTSRGDPEYRQILEGLRDRIVAAASTDSFAGLRIGHTDGLRDYYESIGAYDVIGPYNIPVDERSPFVPASPPPTRSEPAALLLSRAASYAEEKYEPPRFSAISSGGDHTCGLQGDDGVICWGRIRSLAEGESFAVVSSGGQHTCGLRFDGSIGCWGHNNDGQAFPPPGQFMAVSSGSEHTCALRVDGAAQCWGRNRSGQADAPEGETFTSIASGTWHTCALRQDGTPVCWGFDGDGRFPHESHIRLTSITVGRSHTCGLLGSGEAVCWGQNLYGQSVPPRGSVSFQSPQGGPIRVGSAPVVPSYAGAATTSASPRRRRPSVSWHWTAAGATPVESVGMGASPAGGATREASRPRPELTCSRVLRPTPGTTALSARTARPCAGATTMSFSPHRLQGKFSQP